MRPPRYQFPNEVRETTRTMASRMVGDGTIPQTPEELDAWIARAPDARGSLENGGYGTQFTAADLFPLLQVFITQAGGPAPTPDAPPRASRRPFLVAMALAAIVLLVVMVVVLM
jgi:ferric-dicitrate binding protein FerR (iron transport regulator)